MEDNDELLENQDKITICVYFKETDMAAEGFEVRIRDEIEKIRNIHDRFCDVATTLGNRPPDISVSVLVVPDWGHGSSYQHLAYSNNKDIVLDQTRSYFSQTDIVVNNFFEDLSEPEKGYLNNLGEGSNCLDMMKIKSIISNVECRHLQLDSNTIITDYHDLYQQTFYAPDQCDALNAAFYGKKRVMPHSKIVYTPSGTDSKISSALSNKYDEEMPKAENVDRKNKRSKFYNSTFVEAAIDSGVAIEDNPRGSAKMMLGEEKIPEYRITRDILTVTTQSWDDEKTSEIVDLGLPTKMIRGIHCSSKVIESIMKKYVTTTNPRSAGEQLIGISNIELEIGIIRDYLGQCTHEEQKTVINLIHPNKRGDRFAQLLSGNPSCTARDIRVQYGLDDPSTASVAVMYDGYRSAAASLRVSPQIANTSLVEQAAVDITTDKEGEGKESGFKLDS